MPSEVVVGAVEVGRAGRRVVVLVARSEGCLEGIVAQGAVATRSRSCGSREACGS